MRNVTRIAGGLALTLLAGCHESPSIPTPGQVVEVKTTEFWRRVEDAEDYEQVLRGRANEKSGAESEELRIASIDARLKADTLHAGSRIKIVKVEPAKKMMRVEVVEDAGKDERRELAKLRAENDQIAKTDEQKIALAGAVTRNRASLAGKTGWVAIPK